MTDQNQQQPKGTVLLPQNTFHATLTPPSDETGPAASYHKRLHEKVLTIKQASSAPQPAASVCTPPPPCSRSLHLVRLLSIEEQLTNHTHTGNTLGAATNTLGKGVGTVTDAAGNIVTTAGKGVGDTVTGVTQGLGDTTKGK